MAPVTRGLNFNHMEQGISCICLTYGRVEFINEALESFLRQDYPKDKCELIIVNDYAAQDLVFPRENVRIFNFMEQFPTIGSKVAYAIKQAKFDIIATFDDDDIALPNHLKNINKYLTEDYDVLHWSKGVYWNEPEVTSIEFIGNSGFVYRKSAVEKIGGIPNENAGYDTTLSDRLHTLGRTVFASPPLDEVSWFYRWGFTTRSCYHQSGLGYDDASRFPNILVRHAAHIEELRKQGLISTGEVVLNPMWLMDYEQQLKDYITKHK